MTKTVSYNELIAGTTVPHEQRARALQAAYIGESLTRAYTAIGRAIAGLYRGWRERIEHNRSVTYLERLDDRLLADIGLDRATLGETLRSGALRPAAASSVEAVIRKSAPAKTAANQDHAAERRAA